MLYSNSKYFIKNKQIYNIIENMKNIYDIFSRKISIFSMRVKNFFHEFLSFFSLGKKTYLYKKSTNMTPLIYCSLLLSLHFLILYLLSS
jgi:hypothetical protein